MLMVALMVGGAALLIISCLILLCACANSCLCTPSGVRRLARRGRPKAMYAPAAVEEESDDSEEKDASSSGRGRRSAEKGKKQLQLKCKSSAKSEERRRRHTRQRTLIPASPADSDREPAREPEGDGWFSALVADVSKPRLMPPPKDAEARADVTPSDPMPMTDCDDPAEADIRV